MGSMQQFMLMLQKEQTNLNTQHDSFCQFRETINNDFLCSNILGPVYCTELNKDRKLRSDKCPQKKKTYHAD